MIRRRLVTWDEAAPVEKQPTAPCGDCPWRRDSLKGWLGLLSPAQWIKDVLSDARIECHALVGPSGPVQCAGAAIFRGNLCKLPRDRSVLRLPPNRVVVFTGVNEFIDHHEGTIDE